VFPAMVAELEK